MKPPDALRVEDTCNVWVIPSGDDAVCVDFGSGRVLDRLDELGVRRITDLLVTHFHRDNVQGLARAAAAGIRIWVPPFEEQLFTRADERWAAHQTEHNYDVRQLSFSPLASVPVAGVVDEYRWREYGGVRVFALPTPGHTVGSVTYIAELGGERVAFTGDLLYGPGKVWSLAATQWTYGGVEGQAATILSCGILARHAPDRLLPSHGEPMSDASAALGETSHRLSEIMELRRLAERPWNLEQWLDDPWEVLTPHLLRNRTSIASCFALLSETGSALLVDWGYDLWTGMPLGLDRLANRPLLESIGSLKRDYGVSRVEAAVTTHYHDDHVAGLNLLRAIEGTEVWSPANVAPILEQPHRYDLPCLWHEPIPVDRVLQLEEPVRWHEYELRAYALPGHTLYAAAISFEADGRRVLATGDQQGGGAGSEPDGLNYQYRNRFRIDDYVESAELYARLRPDLLITGHWEPRAVDDAYLERLLIDGRRLAALHRELLPLEDADLGAEGFAARMRPYRSAVGSGEEVMLSVEVRNPFPRAERALVALAVPPGWSVQPESREADLGPLGETTVEFRVVASGSGRGVVGADVTVGEVSFGQQAEALVDVA